MRRLPHRDAELIMDPGERWAKPACFDCAEDVVDRMNAHGDNPAAAEAIVRAREEARYRPLPVPVIDWETADMSKLNVLHAQWLRYQAAQREPGLGRCWALVPAGRCVRAESGEGLCETHLVMGARVPGLGWAGDEPMGRIVTRRGKVAA